MASPRCCVPNDRLVDRSRYIATYVTGGTGQGPSRPTPAALGCRHAHTDWADLYRANIDAVTALARGLDADQLSRGCRRRRTGRSATCSPTWRARPPTLLSRRMDGAPWPGVDRPPRRRTRRPFDGRAGRGAPQGSSTRVVATLEGNDRPALVWNCAVHHADLHEALGKGAPPEAMWRPVLEAIGPRMLGESAEAVGRGARLRAVPRLLLATLADPDDRLGYRRSTPAQLDELCIFGPRDDDQPVPGDAQTRRSRGRAPTARREASLLASAAEFLLRVPAAIPLIVSSSARSRAG